MDVVFDRGSAEQPKGHALLYFRSNVDAAEIWVTYVVILPVSVDVSKYVPPFLIDQVAHMGPNDLSAFAFPPAPEMLGSYDDLESLATARDDDILSAGSINPADVPASMMAISEAVEWYSGIYGEIVGVIMDDEEIETESDEVDADLGVNEVLYGLMSGVDKLGELAKLVGTLKFAVEGSDESQIREAEEEMHLLAGHLPENHYVPQLIRAVNSTDSLSARLADLYLKRCFHLVQEDYSGLAQIEQELNLLGAEHHE